MCVNLKMSVAVFLSMVIYIRNDKVRKRMAVMQNEKRRCTRGEGGERHGGEREKGERE